MRLLTVFLDGVGLGRDDPDVNPFASVPTPTLDQLAGGSWLAPAPYAAEGGLFAAVDATLGVDGLPQSATGQSTLISGRDAVRAMDGHYGPWPGPTLKRFLREGEIFSWAADRFGASELAWASAYPSGFFEALTRGRFRLNALAYAAREAGVVLPTLDAFRAGEAIAADLDGAYFASLGVEPPEGHRAGPAGARRAGARLAQIASRKQLTFLDVWATDRVGHAASMGEARALVERIDALLDGLLDGRPDDLTVMLVSDHGNMEDLSHGRHTRASIPLAVVGPAALSFRNVRSLLDVAPVARRAWHASA